MFCRPYYTNYRFRRLLEKTAYLLLISSICVFLLKMFFPSPTKREPEIRLWRSDIGKTVSIPLEQYVAGVLAAEMPSQFELEALRAGAVAARTYALRRIVRGETIPGTLAHVSSDHRVSQAWLSTESLISIWGHRDYLASWPKIKLAVTSTRGQVLTYQGELIQALYHSTSGGVTASSEQYYTAVVPYLRSVPSPWEDESPYFRTKVTFSCEELIAKLGVPAVETAGNLAEAVSVDFYGSGRTRALFLGSTQIPSRTVREKLGLRSSWFTVTCSSGAVTFTVYGNGHGVGMSQYGAQGLARRGYSYDAILRYYYQGAELTKMY